MIVRISPTWLRTINNKDLNVLMEYLHVGSSDIYMVREPATKRLWTLKYRFLWRVEEKIQNEESLIFRTYLLAIEILSNYIVGPKNSPAWYSEISLMDLCPTQGLGKAFRSTEDSEHACWWWKYVDGSAPVIWDPTKVLGVHDVIEAPIVWYGMFNMPCCSWRFSVSLSKSPSYCCLFWPFTSSVHNPEKDETQVERTNGFPTGPRHSICMVFWYFNFWCWRKPYSRLRLWYWWDRRIAQRHTTAPRPLVSGRLEVRRRAFKLSCVCLLPSVCDFAWL